MRVKKKSFSEFIDKKGREGRRQLHIIREVLRKGGMRVADHVESNDDPYIFIANPEAASSFHGVRVYKIGNGVAFRIQREEKTHPYGTAYLLKIPEMFNDLVEDMKEEQAGKKVMEYMVKELKKFFLLSATAETGLQTPDVQGSGDALGRLIVQSSGTDISRQVGNST